MKHRFLTYKNSRVSYLLIGCGPELVFCIHGYGESANSFAFLEPLLEASFTLVAIDLPLHGDTAWNKGEVFDADDLRNIMLLVIDPATRAGIRDAIVDYSSRSAITLLGFSMGGRLALSLYQASPGIFGKLVLLAPDGLHRNPWYWFSTQTSFGNRVFRYVMNNAGFFLRLLASMRKLRLMSASLLKFVQYYVGDKTSRDLLYKRWTLFRGMNPDRRLILTRLKAEDIPVRLVYGRYDRIIKPADGKAFCRSLGEHARLRIIEAGHQVLHEKHRNDIADALLE